MGDNQLAQFGVLNIGFVHTCRLFFEFRLKTGEYKEKMKEQFFRRAKTDKHGYFCFMPSGYPGDFSGFYYFFFDRRHVSNVPFLTDVTFLTFLTLLTDELCAFAAFVFERRITNISLIIM